LLAALERAVAFGRWHAADVRSILAAGAGVVRPREAGDALVIELHSMIVLTVLPPIVKVKITAVDRLVPLVGIPSPGSLSFAASMGPLESLFCHEHGTTLIRDLPLMGHHSEEPAWPPGFRSLGL
jgi:hypothetical protein